MKKLLLILIFITVALPVYATDYTVCSSGCDFTQSQFELETGDYSGDTFYFTDSTYSSQLDINVNGSVGNYVIIDGWLGGSCAPNTTECTNSAEVNRSFGSGYGISIDGESYVQLQDFRVTQTKSNGINIWDSDYVRIYRTEVDTAGNGINDDAQGISLAYGSTYVVIGGSEANGNNIHHIGADTGSGDIQCQGNCQQIITSYNQVWSSGTARGIDGIVNTGCDYWLIEYNTAYGHQENSGDEDAEDGIDMKEAQNIIIRYNHIYDNWKSGINLQHGGDNIYIYGNYVHDNSQDSSASSSSGIGMFAFSDSNPLTDVYIFSNIVVRADHAGIGAQSSGGTINGVTVFNNTLIENGGYYNSPSSDWSGWRFISGNISNVVFNNNIVYKSRPNESDYRQGHLTNASMTSRDNYYYWPSHAANFYLNGDSTTSLADMQSGGYETSSADDNPELENISGGDYRIAAGAPVIGDGYDMGSGAIATVTIQNEDYPVYWYVALASGSSWSAHPPVIVTANRDSVGWDVGAYAATGDTDSTAPVLSSASPSGNLTCTSDPRDVVLQIWAEDAVGVTACKACEDGVGGCSTATDIDVMTINMPNSLANYYSATIEDKACNQTITYNIKCEDAADNESDATQTTFTIIPYPSDIVGGGTGTISGDGSGTITGD